MYTPGLSSKWLNKIKDILQRCGRPDIWQAQHANVNITTMVKKNLIDQYYQERNSSLGNSSKGRNYRLFNGDHNFENYLLKLPKQLYINFARLRTGHHRFPCETGIYQERKCRLCDKNNIGGELHYLLICSFLMRIDQDISRNIFILGQTL